MGWTTSGFLWFMGGAGIPIIIHLLHRQKYKKVRWAAMEWLLAAIRKTRRRLQFENLILLLVRILVMLLLALALARPFMTRASASALGESDTHYIFVIDNSFSMDYKKEQGETSRLELAKKGCQEFIKTLQPSKKDRYTVLALSEYPETSLLGWNELGEVKKRVDSLRVQPYGSDMMAGLLEIQKLLDRASPTAPKNADRRVFLFTDMQRNGWELSDLRAAERFRELLKKLSNEEGTWFHIVDVGAEDAENHAIVDLRVTNKVLTVNRPAEIIVELYNFGIRAVEGKRLQLLVDGQIYETRPVNFAPGAVTPVAFQYRFGERDAGPHVIEARFDPKDEKYDHPTADNRRHLAVEVKDGVRTLLIDGDPKDGTRLNRETGTLEFALKMTGYFKVTWITPHNFYDQKLEDFDFVGLCNVKSLRTDIVTKLEEFVERGGGLFISLGNQIDAVWYNQEMSRCRGTVVDEGGVLRCLKCGDAGFPRSRKDDQGRPVEEFVNEVKRTDPSGREETVLLHSGGRGLLPIRLGEVVGQPDVPRRLGKIDFDHKIFSVFRNVRRAAPGNVIFWKFFKFEECPPRYNGERAPKILAEFDDTDHSAAMVESTWHEGRVVVFASAIDREEDWNVEFPGRPPYFPIMINLGEYLAARSASRLNFRVGEPLKFYLPSDSRKKFFLYSPGAGDDQKPDEITAERRSPQDRFMEILYAPDLSLNPSAGQTRKGIKLPGGYVLRRAGDSSEPRCVPCGVKAAPFARLCQLCGKPVVPEVITTFAANVGPSDTQSESLRGCEGNLEYLPPVRLKERFPEFKVDYIGEKNEKGDELRFEPAKNELWRKILIALLGFLVVESILAALFGRSKQ